MKQRTEQGGLTLLGWLARIAPALAGAVSLILLVKYLWPLGPFSIRDDLRAEASTRAHEIGVERTARMDADSTIEVGSRELRSTMRNIIDVVQLQAIINSDQSSPAERARALARLRRMWRLSLEERP